MIEFLESFALVLIVISLLVGLVGTLIPLLPGTLLMWLGILFYGLVYSFEALTWGGFALISLIALVTGTADLWLTLLGAKKGGASPRSQLFGLLGAIIGTFILPLLGTIIGYATGILLAEYRKRQDWNQALRASLGGLAGYGLASLIQLGGGLLMLILFAWQIWG
ncbi:MAG: DUF456 domain-containing protein [Chloroflexota bacterium]